MDYFSLDFKATFLSSRVVPANDNDAFHDDKCAFCWGEYDDDHPASRILPCNHCFGRDCIQQFADAPSGDLCPIFRTPLFRPPIIAAAERCLMMVSAIIVEYILLAQYQVLAFYANLPPWGKVASEIIYARYTSQFIPYWIGKLINSSTALPAHISKPDLCYQLQILSMKHWFGIQVCCCIRFGVALLGPILHEIRQPELDTGRDITQLLIEPGVDFGMKSTR